MYDMHEWGLVIKPREYQNWTDLLHEATKSPDAKAVYRKDNIFCQVHSTALHLVGYQKHCS